MSSQFTILKTGVIVGGVTIGMSLLTPLISSVFPSSIRSFFFQTYNDPIGSFVNEIIIVYLALNMIEFVPALRDFVY